MLALLVGGFAYRLTTQPSLVAQRGGISIGFRLPGFAVPALFMSEFVSGAV